LPGYNQVLDKQETQGAMAVHLLTEQAMGFLQEPSAKTTEELLSLSTDLPRILMRLLTWHCHLNGHLLKWGW
jgi:hypothetical protein